MEDKLTGSMFRQMVLSAAAAIEQERQHINDLNVFPVPDGDTGTNMSLTLGSGAQELRNDNDERLDSVAAKTAGALLRGARGNSGVILSLLFRGMSRSFKGKEAADAKEVAAALTDGVTAAYSAVMKPAEGTILTVSRLAAEAAVKYAEANTEILPMFETVYETAKIALADTVNLNPVLKKANVVDSGGMGYCWIIYGMICALKGEALVSGTPAAEGATQSRADFSQFETGDIRFSYCTEVIIRIQNEKDPLVLRDFASRMGDSLVMAADDELIKLHVHVNDPGAIMTEAITYGYLEKVKVENMKLQHNQMIFATDSAAAEVEEPRKKYGIVAVCAGEGMEEVFRQLGADAVVTGGQTMNPSTEDIMKAVEAAHAETVFVLPNNKNIIMAAQQCVDLTENEEVVVIPSKTVPQGIAALLTYDETVEKDELTETMTQALGGIQTAQITYAARDSDFDGHTILAGEYLCLLESSLLCNSRDLEDVKTALIQALAPSSPALVTVYYGSDVTEEDANALAEALGQGLEDCEISVINGGQPVYYYMISAE